MRFIEKLSTFNATQSRALRLGLTQVHAVTANLTETKMLDGFRLAQASSEMKNKSFNSYFFNAYCIKYKFD
ncbi:MAG: hypothetical protein ACI9FB_002158 [Candidatus Azotimanducaceae bacterium]|jgi:hypothetical protein